MALCYRRICQDKAQQAIYAVQGIDGARFTPSATLTAILLRHHRPRKHCKARAQPAARIVTHLVFSHAITRMEPSIMRCSAAAANVPVDTYAKPAPSSIGARPTAYIGGLMQSIHSLLLDSCCEVCQLRIHV